MNKLLSAVRFLFQKQLNNFSELTEKEKVDLSTYYSFLSGNDAWMENEKSKENKNLYIWQHYYYKKLIQIIENQENVIFGAPTSYGKSYIARFIAMEHNGKYKRILFILQNKSLINDYKEELENMLKQDSSKKIEIYEYITHENINENGIFLLTQERLLKIKNKNYPKFHIVFIDESGFLLDDITRFWTLEGKINNKNLNHNRVKIFVDVLEDITINEKYDSIILLSHESKIKKIHDVTKVYKSIFKVDFKEYAEKFEITTRAYFYKSENEIICQNKNILSNENFEISSNKFKKYIDSKNKIIPENSLIYSSKAFHYDEAITDIQTNENENIDEEIQKIIEIYGEEHHLSECLKKRIAYHNGNVEPYIRKKIEKLFKEKKIKILYANQTLLKGVNISPNYLILKMISTGGGSEIMRHSIINLFGRIGRIYEENKKEIKNEQICNKKTKSRKGIVFLNIKESLNIINSIIKEKENLFNKEEEEKETAQTELKKAIRQKKIDEFLKDIKESNFNTAYEKNKLNEVKNDDLYSVLDQKIDSKILKTQDVFKTFISIINKLKKDTDEILKYPLENLEKFIQFKKISSYCNNTIKKKWYERKNKSKSEIQDEHFSNLSLIFDKVAEKIHTANDQITNDETTILYNFRIFYNNEKNKDQILKMIKEKKNLWEINKIINKKK